MGAVYRARHAFLRRPTAIKLIRSQVASADTLARFEREVQLTSALTHPNTIAVYDYGRTEDGIFYYAMEYLPGIPLDRAHQGRRPAAGGARRPSRQADLRVAGRGPQGRPRPSRREAGEHDVVRARRPVRRRQGARLRPGQGGRDATTPALTAAHHIVGTPLYMAPESIDGSSTVDARSDVYAVGGVAYALVTGRPVFAGKSGVDIIGHHLHSIPRPPSERLGVAVDPFLERLILSCLAKRPGDRPADAGALLAQIEEGWKGAAWTQAEARAWWETKGPRCWRPAARRRRRPPGSEARGGHGQPHGQRPLARDQRRHRDAHGTGPKRDLTRREGRSERSAPAPAVAGHLDVATMRRDERAAHGQADPHAVGLRRTERVKRRQGASSSSGGPESSMAPRSRRRRPRSGRAARALPAAAAPSRRRRFARGSRPPAGSGSRRRATPGGPGRDRRSGRRPFPWPLRGRGRRCSGSPR